MTAPTRSFGGSSRKRRTASWPTMHALSLAESDHAAASSTTRKKRSPNSRPIPNPIRWCKISRCSISSRSPSKNATGKRSWRRHKSSPLASRRATTRTTPAFTRPRRISISETWTTRRKELDELQKNKADEAVRTAEWFPKLWILQAEIAFREKKYDQVTALVDDSAQVASRKPPALPGR